MKRIIETETKQELEVYLDQQLFIFCGIYHYTGTLIAINDNFLILKNPYIVYETGAWQNKSWNDCQKLPTNELCIRLNSIESYFITKVIP
ncbi:MAG: hypothetical protein ACFFDY_01235 [Candidatus Thorarchaeota archaeon]